MTTKDALTAEIGTVPGIDPNSLIMALARVQMTGTEIYTPLVDASIARATIDVLCTALSATDISEGGFSYKIDVKSITGRITNLIKKYGLFDVSIPGPSIRGVVKW